MQRGTSLLVLLFLLQACVIQGRLEPRHWASALRRRISPRLTDILVRRQIHAISSAYRSTQPAWNGVTPPGSVPDGKPFLPYYVPAGSMAVDDTSRSLIYSPHSWHNLSNPKYVDGTLHSTSTEGAYMTYLFSGTGIQWFGTVGPSHGITDVYMDGKHVDTVDGYATHSAVQQRRWASEQLAYGQHTFRIVNTGRGQGKTMDVDALVVRQSILKKSQEAMGVNLIESMSAATWKLEQRGTTGVSAMQLSVISDTEVIIFDKVEHNPLTVNGHPAWGAVYNLNTDEVRPLNVLSNSFCAGGTFLSNGTLLNVGGNPVVTDKTGAADFGDLDGLQAVRLFTPCDDGTCDVFEDPARIRMSSARWYVTVTRLDDGSALIMGGSKKGGWMNNATVNNPTFEFFPPKNINGYNGVAVSSQFLSNTLNANMFPIAFTLPDGTVFIAANRDSMIYNWKTNQEARLPQFPNGVRVTYPMTGTAVLLPLTIANNYTPTVVICGGSTVDDTMAGYDMSSQAPASDQCVRMTLTTAGIAAGWEVDNMPAPRVMPDAVLLPDGRVVIVNGGRTGIAGYGNVKGQIGQSNADNPVFQPVLYDPNQPLGQRFSSDGMPTSQIARLYHSVATLLPSGEIMIAGSNPNLDVSDTKYQTEYRVEWLSPPYMGMVRPVITTLPANVDYGKQIQVQVQLSPSATNITISLMDLGFVTHAVHMNSRLVELECACTLPSGTNNATTLSITGPPSALIYPPGYGWIYVLVDGVPSAGKRIMVGDGSAPPDDSGATANLLAQTMGPTLKPGQGGQGS
ncbi:copper radical oxidase [Calocera viscosa TUFC12733]|uniref:Copper radical oxidase n=1 Tax=Calocera viscosa (strain TUFC12733) TaxID=1330018 RepID=A0A167LLC2_CALVF|nr:copper radical oxidase [Calocera viscosa TUFC12733]